MSDFSFHNHLKTNNKEDAVQLLHDASVKGYVFPSVNGWTTFVVEDEFNPAIVAANKGILIEMFSSSDFGWGFTLYEGSNIICKFKSEGDEGDTPNFDGFSKDSLLKIISADKADEIDAIVGNWQNSSNDEYPAFKFANIMGLKHVEWISYGYVESDPEIYTEQYGEIIKV